jgi:hypothetical protein
MACWPGAARLSLCARSGLQVGLVIVLRFVGLWSGEDASSSPSVDGDCGWASAPVNFTHFVPGTTDVCLVHGKSLPSQFRQAPV